MKRKMMAVVLMMAMTAGVLGGCGNNAGSNANADENANEEHYWIRAYNDEVEDPIVITVYKK